MAENYKKGGTKSGAGGQNHIRRPSTENSFRRPSPRYVLPPPFAIVVFFYHAPQCQSVARHLQVYPDPPPILVFLIFLFFFCFAFRLSLLFGAFFFFSSKNFRGSAKRRKPCFFRVSLAFLKQGLEGHPTDPAVLKTVQDSELPPGKPIHAGKKSLGINLCANTCGACIRTRANRGIIFEICIRTLALPSVLI